MSQVTSDPARVLPGGALDDEEALADWNYLLVGVHNTPRGGWSLSDLMVPMIWPRLLMSVAWPNSSASLVTAPFVQTTGCLMSTSVLKCSSLAPTTISALLTAYAEAVPPRFGSVVTT